MKLLLLTKNIHGERELSKLFMTTSMEDIENAERQYIAEAKGYSELYEDCRSIKDIEEQMTFLNDGLELLLTEIDPPKELLEKKELIKEEPINCVNCQRSEIIPQEFSYELGNVWRDVTCEKCGKTWIENFTFTEWEYID